MTQRPAARVPMLWALTCMFTRIRNPSSCSPTGPSRRISRTTARPETAPRMAGTTREIGRTLAPRSKVTPGTRCRGAGTVRRVADRPTGEQHPATAAANPQCVTRRTADRRERGRMSLRRTHLAVQQRAAAPARPPARILLIARSLDRWPAVRAALAGRYARPTTSRSRPRLRHRSAHRGSDACAEARAGISLGGTIAEILAIRHPARTPTPAEDDRTTSRRNRCR